MITDYTVSLPVRIAKEIRDFFHFWYFKSSKDLWTHEVSFIKGVADDFGVFINLKLITQPIYGDYSNTGKVIGPIFRLARVLLGFVLILLSVCASIVIYIVWIIAPVLAILMIAENLLYILFL